MRAKRLRFAVIPETISTDAEADLYFSKLDKLVQFFRKYCSDADKDSMYINFENNGRYKRSKIEGNSQKENEKDKEKEIEREKDREKERGRKKKIDVNLLKIWLGTKGDPKWAFLQCDRTASATKVMHVEVPYHLNYCVIIHPQWCTVFYLVYHSNLRHTFDTAQHTRYNTPITTHNMNTHSCTGPHATPG